MNMKISTKAALLFIVAALFAGCCGGSKTTKIETMTPTKTVGEQMIDLQKARDTGAISEDEYKKAKQDILDKLDK